MKLSPQENGVLFNRMIERFPLNTNSLNPITLWQAQSVTQKKVGVIFLVNHDEDRYILTTELDEKFQILTGKPISISWIVVCLNYLENTSFRIEELRSEGSTAKIN